jgi:hypothetical protein
VIVPEYEVASAWDEGSIELPYLQETCGRYKFGQLDYAVTEVLNDQLEEGLRFNFRGDMIEGVIIAYGCEAIPEGYHGVVPVCVTLIDSLERRVQKEIGLLVAELRVGQDNGPVRPSAELHIPGERENTDSPTDNSVNPDVKCGTNIL